jgi:hypothetical protein
MANNRGIIVRPSSLSEQLVIDGNVPGDRRLHGATLEFDELPSPGPESLAQSYISCQSVDRRREGL